SSNPSKNIVILKDQTSRSFQWGNQKQISENRSAQTTLHLSADTPRKKKLALELRKAKKRKNSKNEDLHDSKNEDLHVSSGDSLENICTEADATNNGAARLEVCVDSLESALNAIHGGADELEVCSLLSEGGLTPTAGLVNSILAAIKKIGSGVVLHRTCPEKCACISLTKKPKVNVMIRCRSGSDFAYTELEMDTMLEDIEVFKALGPINRFVFGALTQSQQVDEENCTRVIEQATPHSLTFHRAFDVAVNPVESLNSIVNLGFDRLLTSGQCPTADAPEAVELIRTLQTTFANQIEIMPGSGVNAENVTTFMDLGCKIVHSSCKVLKLLPKIEHNYRIGSANSEHIYVTQEAHVREIKDKMLCYAMVKIEIDEINEYTDENVE
ncbi:hypothetical protein ACJJTC_004732, partial [Scirpophaga incertulas]